MWDLLKQTDIEQAKQKLKLRRAETLRRHAEESQILISGRAELETLYHLVDDFAHKYLKVAKKSPPQPIPVAISSKIIHRGTSPEARHQHHPKQSRTNFAQANVAQTNFDTFARAMRVGTF